MIISSGRDHSISVFDIVDKKIVSKLTIPFPAADLILVYEKDVLFHDRNGQIFILDILTDTEPEVLHSVNRSIEAFAVYNSRNNMAIAGSGSLILSQLNQDGSVTRIKESPLPHSGLISEVAFSPDGNWLAISGFDGMISLWDLSSSDMFEEDPLTLVIYKPGLKIIKLLFDSEGKYLIYSDLKRVLYYPVDIRNNIDQLNLKLKGKKLTDREWGTYIKGELVRPNVENNAW